jgi:hypothetical protein
VINREISIGEIKYALVKAENGKALGPDLIPVEVLRNDTMVTTMHSLFNQCFKMGQIPAVWRKGTITPIHKSGNLSQPMNYRGITVASAMYKLYCSILNNRISTWVEELGILEDNQNGFRKGHSCQDHLSSITMLIEARKQMHKSTFCAFIDFHKAYDGIQRGLLWQKLQAAGLQGNMLEAVKNIYSLVQCSVNINSHMTSWFHVSTGLKQGCILSPVLFNMYLNDFIMEINNRDLGVQIKGEKVGVLCYADDLVLLASCEKDLQLLLDRLAVWCLKWHMKVNPLKSNVVHFRGESCKLTQCKFSIGNEHIHVTSKYKYLGLTLSEHLNFNITATAVAKAAQRALGLLIAKDKAHGGFTFDIFTRLYNTLVQSVINYGSAVWGQKNISAINAVQQRAMKYYLGLPKRAPNAAATGDTGWKSAYAEQWACVTRMWCRLNNMAEHRINKKMFNWVAHLARTGNKKKIGSQGVYISSKNCKLRNTQIFSSLVHMILYLLPGIKFKKLSIHCGKKM